MRVHLTAFTACLAPSLLSLHDRVNGLSWTIQDRAMWIFICGSVATLVMGAAASLLLLLPAARRNPQSHGVEHL